MLPTYIKVNGNVYRLAAPAAAAPDEVAADELRMYIDNTERLYKQKMQMYARLALFTAKKTFNPDLAVKMFRYLTDAAARDYVKEYGPARFDVATRTYAAQQLRDAFLADLKSQAYDFNEMLPAKYKGLPLEI